MDTIGRVMLSDNLEPYSIFVNGYQNTLESICELFAFEYFLATCLGSI